jgi:hypothetical protein
MKQTASMLGVAWLFKTAANMVDLLFSQTASTDCILFVHMDWVLDFISWVKLSQFAIQVVKFSTINNRFINFAYEEDRLLVPHKSC